MDDAAALAIEEYIAATGDPYAITHAAQVTSYGGSGTTALIEHLLDAGVDLQPGPGQWPFKHGRVPPAAREVPAKFRVAYVVGDPRDAVLSIFRRGLQFGHYRALHDEPPSPRVARDLQGLDRFVERGIDHFGLGDHLDRWLTHPPGYPVMFVRYDALAASWGDIRDFFEVADGFPAMRNRRRHSNWRDAPREIRERLAAMYAELADVVAALPAVSIV